MNDGGPAFPTPMYTDHRGEPAGGNSGMSVREYLIAHAPVTLQDAATTLSLSGFREPHPQKGERIFAGFRLPTLLEELARLRVEYADAVLKKASEQ